MIKLLVLDVDGTLTDGKIYIGNNGEEFKAFNIKDGLGIVNAIKHGIIPVIITGRTSKIVEKRAMELGISEIHQGVLNKIGVLDSLLEKYDCQYLDIAYMGDDIVDLECIERCTFTGCPNDAVDVVKNECSFISSKKGGDGAVREFIDYILSL